MCQSGSGLVIWSGRVRLMAKWFHLACNPWADKGSLVKMRLSVGNWSDNVRQETWELTLISRFLYAKVMGQAYLCQHGTKILAAEM